MTIGNKIKNLRNKNFFTQEELADKLNVSRSTISSWENDRSYPDLQTVVELSDFFDTTLDYLLREDKEVIKKMSTDKKKFKKIIFLLSIIILALGIAWLTIWNNQLTNINSSDIKIVKITKHKIPAKVIDGKEIKSDYSYDVYVKLTNRFKKWDLVNQSSNNYFTPGKVFVEFQARHNLNIFYNPDFNKTHKLIIPSFSAQASVNNSKDDPYNIGKDIILEKNFKLINSKDNK